MGPTGYVVHDTHHYSMPPEAANLPATLYLYRDRVRIVAGRYEVTHPRCFEPNRVSTLPEHRAAQLSAISGKRAKRYLKRQHLFDTGQAAVHFLTELVHRYPRTWCRDVDTLHVLLQRHGAQAFDRALRAALDVGAIDTDYVARCLKTTCPVQLRLLAQEVN